MAGVEFLAGARFFPTPVSRLAMGPIQHHIHWVPVPGIKRQGHEADHSLSGAVGQEQ
jgi:hypothetical protein